MEFSYEQINDVLASLVFPFCRIGAMFMSLAIFGVRTVPVRVRLFLALSVTVVVAPVLPKMPDVELFSLHSYIIVIQEIVIGIILGFSSRVLMEIFVIAGQLISMQTGLGFASLVDPVNGASVPLVGQLLLMSAMLFFFLFDGHLMAIQTVIYSFTSLPVGMDSVSKIDFMAMALWGSWMFAAALMLALSSVLALLMLNVAFGVLTRATPQLNLFVIGFPVTMLIGLFLIWLILADLPLHFENELHRAQSLTCEIVGLSC